MDYRNNGDGTWTYFCENCGKSEQVADKRKTRRIKCLSDWSSLLLPAMNPTPFEKIRVGYWLSRYGGKGLCRVCGERRLMYFIDHKAPEEDQ